MQNEIITNPPPPEIKQTGKKLFFIFVVVCFIVIALAFVYLLRSNQVLTSEVTSLNDDAKTQTQKVAALTDSMTSFQSMAEKTEKLAENQEKMMSDWSAIQHGNYDQFYLAEIRGILQEASDVWQSKHDKTLTLSFLQRAQAILLQIKNAHVITFQSALNEEINQLTALPELDISAYFQRILTLDQAVDALPLPKNPLQEGCGLVDTSQLSWWQVGVFHFKQALSRIVLIHKNDKNTAPLIMPDEKAYLFQNLHSQFQLINFGLIQRNNIVYQAGLDHLFAWIKAYFDQDAAATKNMLSQLDELKKIDVTVANINLTDLLNKLPVN